MRFVHVLLVLLLPNAVLFAQELVPGTIIPVMLKHSVSTRNAHPGDAVHARVMQDVISGRTKIIRSGAVLAGEIIRIERDPKKSATRISLRFDQVESHGTRTPVVTSLRALASYVAVEQALIPPIGTSRTVPYEASTFVLIGGDVSYRGGGPVMHGNENVGKPSGDGVVAQVLPNPERGCTSPIDSNVTPQSLWVFSSNACGTYELPTLNIVDRGLSSGEFTLSFPERGIELHSGDGLLLTVITPSR
jgi:hypothetical protein